MSNYYDLYQLGRLIKRLYFEGAGLFFSKKESIEQSEKELSKDCELVNNKAYELCQKLELNHLDIYWKQIFETVQNNTEYNQKEFSVELNRIFKLIDISIDESLSSEESKFYQLGIFLSHSWIYMVASKSFDMSQELQSLQLEINFQKEYKSLKNILNNILRSVHEGNISSFNEKIDSLIDEIKKIDRGREMSKKKGNDTDIKISGTGHNIQIGNNNKIEVNDAISALVETIKDSDFSEKDKEEAKSLLDNFLKHPILSSVIGGVISSL